ncbi:MAG: hypothetical protein SF028_06330 [Candidatus Sumerlaeia bacterium]|nr:hypothetical protein [Candidatus Sumerlaeia bacterium]
MASAAPGDLGRFERLVRYLCADTPDVAMEKRLEPIVYRDESGAIAMQVRLLVALETEADDACNRFLARVHELLQRLPETPISHIEVCVTGRYPRKPPPKTKTYQAH